MNVLAHGLTDATLPLPAEVVQLLGIAGIAVAYLWSPAQRSATAPAVARATPAHATSAVILGRVVVGLIVAAAITTGLFGPDDAAENAGSRLLWILLPALLLIGALTFGQRILLVNPLRVIAAQSLPSSQEEPFTQVDPRLGHRVAISGLFVLVWLRLFIADDPFLAATAAAGYVLLSLAAVVAYGRSWFRWGDPIGLAVTTISLGRASGRHTSSSADNGAVVPVRACVAVLVGAAVFESIVERAGFARLVQGLDPAALAVVLGLTIGMVYLAAKAAAPVVELAPALVPVAAGYLGVHALGPLVIDAQIIGLQVADSVAAAFGKPGIVLVEPVEFVAPEVLGSLSVLVLGAGHVCAVLRAQRLPLPSLTPSRQAAVRLQFAGVVGASLFLGLRVLF